MNLDPAEAEFGYKFSTDCAGDLPWSLCNEHDLRNAMEHGQGLVQRARTRKIGVMVHNLVSLSYPCLSFLLTSNTQKPAVKLPATAKTLKRKEPTGDTVAENASIDVTDMLRQLKEHLSCAKHGGRWCYVSPIDGQHRELDIFVLTLWAKKIVSSLNISCVYTGSWDVYSLPTKQLFSSHQTFYILTSP